MSPQSIRVYDYGCLLVYHSRRTGYLRERNLINLVLPPQREFEDESRKEMLVPRERALFRVV